MATPIWISSDGDWGNTASWSTGAVPVNDDTAMFDGLNSVVSVTGGLEQTGVNLARLQSNPAYTGDIGLNGNPLHIDALTVLHRGTGTLYFKSDGGQNHIQVDSTNLINAAVLSGTSSAYIVTVKKGRVTCSDEMGNIFGAQLMSDLASLIIEKNGAATLGNLLIQTGQVLNNRAITAIATVNGGYLVHEQGTVLEMRNHGGTILYETSDVVTIVVAGRGLTAFTVPGAGEVVAGLVIFPGADAVFQSGTSAGTTVDYNEEIP